MRASVRCAPAAAAVGAAWYTRLSREDRVRAAANHHRLQPHLDHAAAAALARRSYQEYVRMIVEFDVGRTAGFRGGAQSSFG